jgi:hypothetical protein
MAKIEDAKIDFQHVWLENLATHHEPITFPPHLHQIDDMVVGTKSYS